jgi:hypothetical protein
MVSTENELDKKISMKKKIGTNILNKPHAFHRFIFLYREHTQGFMTKATKKTAFKGPKRGHASSDADVDDGTNRPWKHSKTGHLMLPVEDGGKGSSRSRTAPPSHLLPACINPAVNPMGPDKRQARTSAEVTAAPGRKKKLRAKLEKIEKKKALILAEIQAAEEEEEQEEKRAIRDVTGLAKSPPSANQLGVDGTNNNDLADGNAYSKGARKHKTLKNEVSCFIFVQFKSVLTRNEVYPRR